MQTMASTKYGIQLDDVNDIRKLQLFIQTSYILKPKELFIDELKWKHLVRNCIRGENTLMLAPSGTGKTMAAMALQVALGRPGFVFNLGSTQDARSALIGNTSYSPNEGTFFNASEFVNAIQTENAIIVLDELTRGSDDSWNILMSVLDERQRYIRLDEKSNNAIIEVAKGVSFIATANIGIEYTSTKILDKALLERFSIIEIDYLSLSQEIELLSMFYPAVDKSILTAIAGIAEDSRIEVKSNAPKISFAISTRITKKMASLVNDGFSFKEAADLAILPYYSTDSLSGGVDGIDSERTYINKLVLSHKPAKYENKNLFDSDDLEKAFDSIKVKTV